MLALFAHSLLRLAKYARQRAGHSQRPIGIFAAIGILRRREKSRGDIGAVIVKTVEIFTDGACKGNPGPGGWGAIIRYGTHEKEISGGDPDTTNNRMEMWAAIQALNILIEPCQVKLHTDSKYVLEGITKWVHGWQRNGWKNASKQPVRNADLWHDLIEAVAKHEVEWIWVKGHNGHPENERADRLASDAANVAAGR